MIVIARIRLTKAMLGDMSPGRDGRRLFRKEGKQVLVNDAQWREQFRTAAKEIPLAVDAGAIHPPRTMLPASYHLYVRNYSQVKTDHFESFRKGTVLTINFRIQESPRAPSLAQFQDLLSFVGTWLGLSPWGSKFGYGRFEVLELNRADQVTLELPDTNQSNDISTVPCNGGPQRPGQCEAVPSDRPEDPASAS